MTHPLMARAAAVLLVAVLAGGCTHPSRLGPPIPSGATIIGGPDMTSYPPPPPGWKERPVIPTSQQQAQDTILGYLKKTLRALPAGTTLDATGYSGGTSTAPCDDNATSPKSPKDMATIGELKLPAGVDPAAIIAKVGDIWKSWGWYVIEREGFYKPNRFGYGPDGYGLQIIARPPPGIPLTLEGISPCFPGDLPDDRSPFPMVLKAD
ncbi:hypothetical protein MSM1_04560 [Mycobacterium sp. SM1]|uniref:hypothetical protein n=1 Tax=Mycobacterium sp. SM1 TaxID=2816243 RepID=UPI001BCFE176|nr:hypothetical protein [Mycobacterium sp. SM1]MBS4727647.1 hypothetical protein [Mycobacterium sp. SM1]